MGLFAKTLVQNTVMKRKVSPYLETVGGDIDVAIINKSDGFIWLNKKQYFDSNINRQFLIKELKKYN